MIYRELDRFGEVLQHQIDATCQRISERSIGAVAYGVALALAIVLAGLGAFILVLFVLVHFFA